MPASAAHPAVIFADDFENGELGARWEEKGAGKGKALSLAACRARRVCGQRCMKVEARLGENQGDGLTKWFEPADRVFVRFYVRFDPGCDYVHHFVTLRANKGLRGGDKWSGFGGAGLRPAGDERFSTALEPWGNWARWPAPGQMELLQLLARDASLARRQVLGQLVPGRAAGRSSPRTAGSAPSSCSSTTRRASRTANRPSGLTAALLGHWRGINWRKTATLQANALTLESYVTDRWTKNPTNIVCFDNLVIAREYIGPAGLD